MAPQNGHTGTQGPPGSWNKPQTTFRNSTGLPEGRFSGSKCLPVNIRGTFTENRDHSDPRTPQVIRGTTEKARSQAIRSSRANGLRSGTTSRRSPYEAKRVTETNIEVHKEQSGTEGIQLHSERPNRAKPTLEAPGRPNIRSHDVWRY
ncbi:hypothetical protein CDL15_Pgr009377 [Punica granatum]|uniref:Uncharacterized protein n=1 Tax=Punica granatum TaxID=22663 RepID=A0A218WZN3_PUNGR|nr:hypothetical protein CDL15_Pgr009377 [Punica granatum]